MIHIALQKFSEWTQTRTDTVTFVLLHISESTTLQPTVNFEMKFHETRTVYVYLQCCNQRKFTNAINNLLHSIV